MAPESESFRDIPVGSVVQQCSLQKGTSQPVHWVVVQLKDEDGDPVPDEPYRVTLSNGDVVRGFLDKNGEARIDGIETLADCHVTFPQLDKDTW